MLPADLVKRAVHERLIMALRIQTLVYPLDPLSRVRTCVPDA